MKKPTPDKHWNGDPGSRHMPILTQASLAYKYNCRLGGRVQVEEVY